MEKRVERFFGYSVALLFFLVGLIMLLGGIRDLQANYRALSWRPTRAKVVGCFPSVEKNVDEDSNPSETWSLNFKVIYEYEFGGKSFQGSTRRTRDLGTAEPTPAQVASMVQELRVSLGDGFVAVVNPASPAESMVEPSLGPPIAFTLLGFGMLVLVRWVFRHVRQAKSSEEDQESV